MHTDDAQLRVMTYNIRACLGVDGLRSLERIAEVIADERPDVVALQEVDLVRARSGSIDQAAAIAGAIGMHAVAAPSFTEAGGGYGNAILARGPIRLLRHLPLPHDARSEPRSAIIARVELPNRTLHVLNTHLSFRRTDRPLQIAELLASCLTAPAIARGLILCGDLNCSSRDRGFRSLLRLLRDAQLDMQQSSGRRPRATWPTRRPIRRLDHILVSPAMAVRDARVVRTSRARRASDHFPFLADIALPVAVMPSS